MPNRNPSGWLSANKKAPNGISMLGSVVAEVLDSVWGIHNVPFTKSGIEWDNTHHIVVTLSWQTLATVDDNRLTMLVVLAHDNALRMSVAAKSKNCLELMFHQRQREGNFAEVCPAIEDHIAAIRRRTLLQDGAGK